MRIETADQNAVLDPALMREVKAGMLFFTRQKSARNYNRPFFDPEFAYRLKQALEVYWEDDTLDDWGHYQIAENLINRGCDIHHQISVLATKKKITRLEILRRVTQAKEILDTPGTFQFDLHALSRECTMSKYFLIRSFKQVFGITPQKYVFRKRLTAAKKLLEQGRSVTATARILGYPDVFSFSKQFKKYVGVPPVSFRARSTD